MLITDITDIQPSKLANGGLTLTVKTPDSEKYQVQLGTVATEKLLYALESGEAFSGETKPKGKG